MSKNYLLIYSEQLATDIELMCKALRRRQTHFFKFEKVQVVFMPISVRQITVKVKQTCFPNLKLHSKNVVKRKVGYNYCLIQMALMKIHIKITEISAVVLEEC